MDEIRRALLGDKEAAKWLTDAGVLPKMEMLEGMK